MLLVQRVFHVEGLVGPGVFGSFFLAALLLLLIIIFRRKGIPWPPQTRWLAIFITVIGWMIISYALNSVVILLPFLAMLPAFLRQWLAEREASANPKQ